jgi:hypothetical protein
MKKGIRQMIGVDDDGECDENDFDADDDLIEFLFILLL